MSRRRTAREIIAASGRSSCDEGSAQIDIGIHAARDGIAPASTSRLAGCTAWRRGRAGLFVSGANTLTAPLVAGVAGAPGRAVLQIDAHADLREGLGDPQPPSAMRRVLETRGGRYYPQPVGAQRAIRFEHDQNGDWNMRNDLAWIAVVDARRQGLHHDRLRRHRL
jgi:arginase family enzyme